VTGRMEIYQSRETHVVGKMPWEANHTGDLVHRTPCAALVALDDFSARLFTSPESVLEILRGDLFLWSHREYGKDIFYVFRPRVSEVTPAHDHGVFLGMDKVADRVMLGDSAGRYQIQQLGILS